MIKCWDNVDEIYKSFQFDKIKSDKNYSVYAYDNGYFSNIEIFALNSDSEEVKREKDYYSDSGMPVRIVSYENEEILHEKLYRGFFRVSKYIERNKRIYDEHCEAETRKISLSDPNAIYKYVQGDFYKNGSEKQIDDLVSLLGKELLHNDSRLIILEAAAGMGKTSTSYETFNYLLTHRSSKDLYIPVLIELTKNRNARIFRHVLDDEIDRNFTGLKRDLVLQEIKLGNILLIIDGFDELLTRHANENDELANGTAQSMLDTIAELFNKDCKTKIILTSRKSSIFVGEQFEEWAVKKMPNILINRYQLAKPTILQWLGREKLQLIQEKKIPIQSLENPVLLAFYRYSSIETMAKINQEYSVTDKYFEVILEREVERQQLKLSVIEQKNIFVQLAKWFVELESMAENTEAIKEIFMDILQNSISEYLNRYLDPSERPESEEEFAMKFVRHALLDRVKPQSVEIGFINELVFGTLIAEWLVGDQCKTTEKINANYLLMASASYAYEEESKRQELYNKIKHFEDTINIKQILSIQLDLLKNINRNYQEEYFDAIVFSDISLSNGKFINCTFMSCVFERCNIDFGIFIGCTFVNCKFYCNEIVALEEMTSSFFVNCAKDFDAPEKKIIIERNDETNYRKTILENFWKPGKSMAESQRSENAIYRGTNPNERARIAIQIEELISEGILSYASGYYTLRHEKMAEIRNILGR